MLINKGWHTNTHTHQIYTLPNTVTHTQAFVFYSIKNNSRIQTATSVLLFLHVYAAKTKTKISIAINKNDQFIF